MCWMAAIPIAMAGAKSISDQATEAKVLGAQINAGRRQAMELLKQTNIQNADLTLQAKSNLEEASAELSTQNMQKVQAMGAIRAAIGESNLEGRSMERIQRVTEGQFVREANMVTENYRRNYQAIFAQQIGAHQSTVSQIKEIYKGEPKGKSKLQQILDPLAVVGGQTASSYASGAFDESTFGGKFSSKSTAKGGKK